jgi:hypothetical protein
MTKKTESKEIQSIQDQLRKDLATLKDRVDPPSGFTISTKGKTFTLPDGTSDPGPMTCVILDWCTANVYFEGIYNPQDIKPPVCFALGRLVAEMEPSEHAPKKQNDTCKGCPQNEWGSAGGGSKGKACKNTRRVLIARPNADETTSPWIISVSPTGLKHFDKYVNTLADLEQHPIEMLTEISFEPSEAYPSLRFKPIKKHDDIALMWQLKEKGQEILFQEPQVEEDKAA